MLNDEAPIMYATPPLSAALLLVKVLLVILKFNVSNYVLNNVMTPPSSFALLLVNILLVILNVNLTPPSLAALLLVNILLVILNDESNLYAHDTTIITCTVVSKSTAGDIK